MQEQFGYAYDKAWNLSGRTNNALIQSFAVNSLNELSGASHSGTLTVAGTATEPGSEVSSVSVNGQSASVYADGSFAATGFTPANGNNTYTAIAEDQSYPPRWSTNSVTVNVPGGASYAYDLNGNLTSDGTRSFAYDDENELIAVWVGRSWSNSFAYDGLMRKRIEQDFAWTGSAWAETNEVHYVYDGNLVLQERDKNNSPMTTYTRGVDISGTLQGAGGIGGLLARSDNQKIVPAILTPVHPNPQNVVTSYYFNDAQGNIAALMSPTLMILAQYEYDPFGNLISKSGLLADLNKYRYSSKEWEGNAGLYYFGYRFYDPNLQRWLNQDPLASHPLSMMFPGKDGTLMARPIPAELLVGPNLYEFVGNNPINTVDPLGLWQFTITAGALLGGQLSFGYNSGQWNLAAYVGLAEGISASLDPKNSECHNKGVDTGIQAEGQIGLGPNVTLEEHIATSSNGNNSLNLGLGLPGTPLGGSFGTEGVTVPTFSFGEGAVIGWGAQEHF